MKKLVLVAALAAFAFSGQAARADSLHANPFNGPVKGYAGGLFRKTPLPAFQAAPWYLYFPYNAHFQTPSPMYNAPWYGPPGNGYGGLVNPYFPNPNYGYGAPGMMAPPAGAMPLAPGAAVPPPPVK